MNNNDLTSAICDMEDIKKTIISKKLWNCPKDNEGTEITLGDCLEDVLEFLKSNELQGTNTDQHFNLIKCYLNGEGLLFEENLYDLDDIKDFASWVTQILSPEIAKTILIDIISRISQLKEE